MISEEDCIRGLREVAEELEKSPTKSEYEALGVSPSSSAILRVMGSWNEAKQAAGLETYTQSEGGGIPVQPKPAEVSIPTDQDWEELSAQQRWYYKNREHRIRVKTRRKKELQHWFFEYKRDNCECEHCGEAFPGCLDFHHVSNKREDISRMVAFGYSKDSIRAELERCVVLCANCHQKEHLDPKIGVAGNSDSIPPAEVEFPRVEDFDGTDYELRSKVREWVSAYKVRTGGCSRCEVGDPRCLEFHHPVSDDEKTPISTLIALESAKGRFLKEFRKCEILCRNCHRKEHYEKPQQQG